MKECAEKTVEVGFTRDPVSVVDDVEQITAGMIRDGWTLVDTCLEDSLGYVHLFFEREIPNNNTKEIL